MTAQTLGLQASASRPWRRILLAAGTLVLGAGCSVPVRNAPARDPHHATYAGAQLVRERELQAAWRGKAYRSLVEAMGAPRRSFTIPGRDPSTTWAVHYGIRDTRAGCFEAFTIAVTDGEERVVDCFCR